MGSFFEEGSPLIRFLNRIADLLILNLMTMLMCLPIVTIGVSLTAMHYVLLKIVRDEEGYIIKSYFRSLKRNFLQATGLWAVFALVWALLISSLIMIFQGTADSPAWLPLTLLIVAVLLWTVMIYAFALLARYDNSVFQTLFNALSLTFGEPLRSLEMLVITLVPAAVFIKASVLLPFVVLFGLSVPGYACAMVYDPVFKKIEKQAAERRSDGTEEELEEEEHEI